jgi:hypothetical protein
MKVKIGEELTAIHSIKLSKKSMCISHVRKLDNLFIYFFISNKEFY